MEEDPSTEWEIVDYSSSCLEDEEGEEKSKLGWILNAGLSLGKKLLITGVVISSVPIVVPPLVVISALGMAFSVPFGFVYASYACTEKLMSKLLLLPASPPATSSSQMIDEYATEEEEEGILVDHDIIEKEEKEQGEVLKDGIEMRIELMDHDDDDDDDDAGEQEITSVKFTDKAEGYEELDVVVEGKDDKIKIDEEKPYALNMTAVDDGGSAIKTHDEVAREVPRNTGHMQILDVKNTIMPMPLSTSSQTNNFDEEVGKNENAEADDEVIFSGTKGTHKETVPKEKSSSSKKMERRGKRKKSSGKRKEAEGEGEKKRHVKEKELLLEETKTSSENNNLMKGKVEALEKEQGQQVVVEEEKNVSSEKEHAHESEDLNNNNDNNTQTRIGENIVIITDVLGSSLEKEEEPTWQGQSVRNGVVSDDDAKMSTDLVASETKTSSTENNLILNGKLGAGEEQLSQEVVVEEEKDIEEVSSVAGPREHIMLESREDLNDNIQTSSGENIMMIDDLGKFERSLEKEEEPVGLKTSSQGQSVLRDGVLSVASETTEENYAKIADDGENSLEVAPSKLEHNEEETQTPVKEEENVSAAAYSDEEKIWKEMEAIRVIVGFRAPTRPSYFEELKALYLFTGIEPPSSFTDPSDLSEFGNKLRFLKSVIGLK